MRIFFAGIMHESSNFSPIPTTEQSFSWQLWRPRLTPMPPAHVDTCGLGPGIELARSRGHEAICGFFAMAQPGAPMQMQTWQKFRQEILLDLKAAMPVDAVFLMLHGAQMAVGEVDCEGDLLTQVRTCIGPEVPIGVELDLHTNLTRSMIDQATAIIACKEYPHIDYAERSAELLTILEGVHAGKLRPIIVAMRVPVLGLFPTTCEPMAGFVEELKAAETKPILSISVLHGFDLADHADTAASILVVSDSDLVAARRVVATLAERFLAIATTTNLRQTLTIAEALDAAQAVKGCCVIADSNDNPGGGAGGDDTAMLRALLERGVQAVALGMIWDPMAVEFAHSAGVGGKLRLRLGGKSTPGGSLPVDLEVEVIAVREDASQPVFGVGPARQPLGRSAALRCGGLDIVINDLRQQVFARHCFSEHGMDLAHYRLVVVKSSQHFYRDFAAIAKQVIYCEQKRLEDTIADYKALRRPLFPFDPVEMLSLQYL